MKKLNAVPGTLIAAFLLFSSSLMAQDTEVKVKIVKNGTVVEDTTYNFESDEEARHALKMLGLMSGEELEGLMGEEMVWIGEEEMEDGKVKVRKYKIGSEGEDGEEEIIVLKRGDEESLEVIVESDDHGDHAVKKKKKVKVRVMEDDQGTWDMEEKELDGDTEEIDVIIIKKKKPEKDNK